MNMFEWPPEGRRMIKQEAQVLTHLYRTGVLDGRWSHLFGKRHHNNNNQNKNSQKDCPY